MGGEKFCHDIAHSCKRGSPPHGRGKVCAGELGHRDEGITPAWAGKSWSDTILTLVRMDHPRMGGEKRMPPRMGFWLRGSPPHGRGKDLETDSPPSCSGITPAWAGKSFHWHSLPMFHWDHPRMGGEKLKRLRKAYRGKGSPPHGRGKGVIIVCEVCCWGITPAWAGKRARTSSMRRRIRDHPRVGGEKPRLPGEPPPQRGSPPRGRGKGLQPFFRDGVLGITPAWAGKSCQVVHGDRA